MKRSENDSIQQKIIKTLLESPKTTGEIVTALGYKKTEYHNVTPALNRLKSAGYIRGEVLKEKGRKGQPPTIYNVILELSTIKKILDKYPLITSDLQKNDKIIDLIYSNIKKESNDFLCAFDGEDLFKETVKFIPDMFRYSVTFLKMFLINEYYISSFYRTLFLIYRSDELFMEYNEADNVIGRRKNPKQISKFNNFDCFENMDFDSFWIFFEAFNHSVINDFINEYGNVKALKLIEKLRNLDFNRSVYETTELEITFEGDEKVQKEIQKRLERDIEKERKERLERDK